MTTLPKDYTAQENIIAECLTEFGIRYEQQADFFPYTPDFYISELKMIIEADGKHGHLRKNDVKRDGNLLKLEEIEYIIHIRETTKGKIKEALWQGLNKLDENEPKKIFKTDG